MQTRPAHPVNEETHSFSVNLSTQGNVEILSLNGGMHDLEFPILEDVLRRLLRENRCLVILECSKLHSASSVTLLRLLTYVRSFREKGGDLDLAVLPPPIAGLARVLDLKTKIDCHLDVATAVNALTGGASAPRLSKQA
jgi:anti-anti-sigma regulatory factor